MVFFKPDTPDTPPHVEVWDKQTLTDTGVRTEAFAPIIGAYPERRWLIGAQANELYVFDVDTGELIEQREGFVDFFREAHFNADGTRMITLNNNGDATLWDTDSWEHVIDFSAGDGDGVSAAAFAPSGELVTADPSGTIVVRDPETHEPIGSPLIGHRGEVGPLWISTDGTRLLSKSDDGSILWDIATRTRIGDAFPAINLWPGPDSSDRAVSLFVEDDSILIWNLNTDEWYDIACRAAGRNMTRAEWEELGPRDAEYQATCPQFPLEAEAGS